MTKLPIHLVLAQVALIGQDEETGTRWTLGPTWYEDHKDDIEYLPYYDDGDRSIELETTAPRPVKTWAAKMIALTTDYRVTKWNGLVPNLNVERHALEIWTVASARTSYTVPAGDATKVIHLLSNPDEVIEIPLPEGVTTHIPVRAITAINHTVTKSQVANG